MFWPFLKINSLSDKSDKVKIKSLQNMQMALNNKMVIFQNLTVKTYVDKLVRGLESIWRVAIKCFTKLNFGSVSHILPILIWTS